LLKVVNSPAKIKRIDHIRGLTTNKEILFEEFISEDIEAKIRKEISKEIGAKIKKILQDKSKEFEQKIEEERKTWYEKGLQEGEEKGIKAGEDQIKDLLDNLKKVLDDINSKRNDILHEAEKTIIGLAFNISKEIIKKELEEDKELIVDIVQDALKFATDEGKVILRLNPEDLNIIQEKIFFPSTKGGKNIEITGDKSISQGGCYIETNAGEIDATLETRLKEMELKLAKSLKEDE